jgi:meiotically up-regulated gene 157 (Mug157) protein
MQAMTSDDDKEITECITLVLKASRLGLVHESINVNRIIDYTRKFQPPMFICFMVPADL